MKFPTRTSSPALLPGIYAPAFADRRVGAVLPRLRRGSIAVIDAPDLDRVTAMALVERDVVAVVNASPFITGRFPNRGPGVLVDSGVRMVDNVGAAVFTGLRDGTTLRLDEGRLYDGEKLVAEGREVTPDVVERLLEDSRTGMLNHLETFTHNTTDFLRREQSLLLHGEGLPTLRTRVEGRPVVVVGEGEEARADLRRLKRYLSEQKPVLVGVGVGADTALSLRLRPDVVVAGQDAFPRAGVDARPSVSDKALRGARDVVLHSDESDRLLGADRVEKLGVRPSRVASAGTSEDVALLISDLAGASVVITAGTHTSLADLLDRQRSGLASTFLTRLRVGPRLVDARGVEQLYGGRVRLWQLVLVLAAGLLAVLLAVASTPAGQDWVSDLRTRLDDSALVVGGGPR